MTGPAAAPAVVVVGLHGGQGYGPAADAAISGADLVVGSPRQLAATAARRAGRQPDGAGSPDRAGARSPDPNPDLDQGPQDTLILAGPISDVLDRVAAARHAGRRVCVLASGDPGFFGIVRVLRNRFGPDLVVHPAPSAVALAFARLGERWDDAKVVSAHGRPLAEAVQAAVDADHRSVAVLTSPAAPPETLGQALLAAGHPPCRVAVASHLGDADETLTDTDLAGLAAGHFDPMSVVVLHERRPPGPDRPNLAWDGTPDRPAALGWGLPEAEFDHRDGMITKAEVRAVVLGKLGLPATGVLWDLGSGSGAVAVECARLAPGLRVVAVERDPAQLDRIRTNARRHEVGVEVVAGEVPAVLSELPDPDRVFVGGGGLPAVDGALARLRPDGRVVATFAILERAAQAAAALGHLTQLAVSRGVASGDLGFRLRAENPVFVCWGPDA